MSTYFKKLNDGWDAEPGAPEPNVRADGSGLTLTFFLNSSVNPKFRDYDRGEIFFPNCWRYRLGYPNDEGWYKGQCRFRCLAPEWGEFYEVSGDLLDSGPKDWTLLRPPHPDSSRHFLFYFKDETFECDADGWSFKVLPVSDADYQRFRSSERRVELRRSSLRSGIRDLVVEPSAPPKDGSVEQRLITDWPGVKRRGHELDRVVQGDTVATGLYENASRLAVVECLDRPEAYPTKVRSASTTTSPRPSR